MKIILPWVLSLFISVQLFAQEGWDWITEIDVIDFDQFKPDLYHNNDTTYVINFWATWCRPCVAELPQFEQLNRNYQGQPVKVILVSLDFEGQTKKTLIPFINRNKIKSEVIHLVDPRMNAWINEVSLNWSGALPGTLIYNNKDRMFYEGSFEQYHELLDKVKSFL